MALRLYRSNGEEQVELDAAGICNLRLVVGYGHPATLRFTILAPQHSLPFAFNDGVAFFDDAYSDEEPLFIGHVRQLTPGTTPNEVQVACHDPMARVGEEVVVTNGLGTLPTAIPRAVYNVTIDHDEDKGYEQLTYPPTSTPYGPVAVYATVAQILQDLFDNQAALLRPLWAAPESAAPYVSADLASMDYQPQEKLVFDSENLLNAVRRLLQLYPAKRLFFDPAERKFRVHQPLDAASTTLTLNQIQDVDHPVLSMHLDRVLDKRFTAFRLVGKPETQFADVSVSAGTLTPLPDGPGGLCRRWQVTDPAKRHLSRFINPGRWVLVAIPQGNAGILLTYYLFEQPALLVTWDEGETWGPVNQFQLQISKGLVETPTYLYRLEGEPPTQTRESPDDVRFVFNYFSASISLRVPASGFAGTAFTDFGVQNERRVYHELLNTGFLKWDTTTQQEKVTQYTKLASQALRAYQDAVYTGGCTLLGIDYRWLRLNRRVNLAAVDADGATLETGWEAANAILTDVEYDYSDAGRTTLTFSSDLMAYIQTDVERLRRILKIKARAVYKQFFMFNSNWRRTEGGGIQMDLSAGFPVVRVDMEG